MDKISAKKIKEESIRIHRKNEKVRKIQKRIGIVGVIGLIALLLSVFAGGLVDRKQHIEKTIEIQTDKTPNDLIVKFMEVMPTILGEKLDKKQLVGDGLWIEADDIVYKVLVGANLKNNTIVYKLITCDIEVSGEWEFELTALEGKVGVKVIENSETENIGYRSRLFFKGTDLYMNNLLKAIQGI